MYLDLGKWITARICIVLEWTPEEASLLQDRPSLAVCCSVSLHLKGTWETQDHQKFCMRLVWKPTSALFWVSDSNLRQHRTSDSIGPPTVSDFISDSVGLLSPTASDFYLRQRRTSISDSVGLLSPTASDFYLRQRRTSISDSVGLLLSDVKASYCLSIVLYKI